MKKRRTIFMNIFQSVSSVGFLFTVIGIAVLCIVSVWTYLPEKENFSEANMLNIFDLLIGLSAFKKILVILAAAPIVSSFCNDWNCQYIRPVVIRSGIRNYIWSKVTACTLAAFGTVFAGVLLLFGVLSIWIPLIPKDLAGFIFPPFASVAINVSPILYLLVNAFVFSFGCAFWVIIGLTISAYIPNRFVAIMTPLIASYILEDLTMDILPKPINLYNLTRVNDVINQGATLSFLYYLVIFGSFIFLLGLLFSRQVKRRIRNEII